VVIAAVAYICGVSHVHAATHKSQRTPVFLHCRIKRQIVIVSGGIYVDGPARISRARVDVHRENEMLFRGAAIWRGEGIEQERARREMDDRGTGDANRIDVTAPEVV